MSHVAPRRFGASPKIKNLEEEIHEDKGRGTGQGRTDGAKARLAELNAMMKPVSESVWSV
jgi:hypothetical protein